MAHQLMRERTGNPVDGEGVACMLERGKMTGMHDGAKHALLALGGHRLHKFLGSDGRVAQAGSRGDGALGVGRMVQKLYFHNASFFVGTMLGRRRAG